MGIDRIIFFKSKKYFLNLNKKVQKQKIILKIICDYVTYREHEGVSESVMGFYQRPYSDVEVECSEDDFYDKCPKLSQTSRDLIIAELMAS